MNAQLSPDSQEIFEVMLESVVICDRAARVIYVNATAERLLGRGRDQLLGRLLSDLAPDGMEESFGEAFDRVARGGPAESVDRYYAPWDQWFLTRLYPLRDLIYIIASDVTAERVATLRLESAAQQMGRLQRLTEGLAAALSTDQVARALVQAGRAALDAAASFAWLLDTRADTFTLVASEGFEGPRLEAFRRIPAASDNPICRVARSGEALLFESREQLGPFAPLTRQGGPSPFNAWAVVPLRVGGRGVGGVALSFSRERPFPAQERSLLTAMASVAAQALDRARLYDAERRALELAREADQRKDAFLAMLGHELRNPLAPIMTAVGLLRLKGVPNADRELGIIERQAHHLVSLVNDLLDVSRITQGKLVLKPQPLEMAAVIARALETVSPLLEEKRHTVVLDVPRAGLPVLGDEMRLAQVFANLLGNAAKYTPPAGRLHVQAGRRDSAVFVVVTDNGMGIAPEMLPVLFDPFVQGARAIDRSEGGLGLGLALVRSLVELHRGRVTAHSDGIGQGSAFEVVLPALEQVAPGARTDLPAGAAVRKPAGRRRILVVDDNRDAAELLSDALAELGHEVRVASDPVEALRAAEEFPAEVAVLDIGLPVMDGYELGGKLRDRLGDGVELIAVTGYGQESDRDRSRAAGFKAHLVKPIELETLAQAVRDGAGALPR
jgi:signal transduction histidine kinase/ActR/RegA family two-component response regulator